MPHSAEERRKVLSRIHRIQGQLNSLERAVDEGVACPHVLQQIAAVRGAVHGLMSEVLASHLRETFGPFADVLGDGSQVLTNSIDDAVELVHKYTK